MIAYLVFKPYLNLFIEYIVRRKSLTIDTQGRHKVKSIVIISIASIVCDRIIKNYDYRGVYLLINMPPSWWTCSVIAIKEGKRRPLCTSEKRKLNRALFYSFLKTQFVWYINAIKFDIVMLKVIHHGEFMLVLLPSKLNIFRMTSVAVYFKYISAGDTIIK